MEFTHKFPEWQNEGIEPSESLATKGFEVGNKPPATVFNWLFYKTGKAIDELQGALVNGAGIPIVVATSEYGTAYTAEVPGITDLYEGLTICLMPNRNSSVSQPTLDVNGLGAIRIGILSTFNNAGVVPAPIDTWLSANRPINVTYHTMRSTLTGEVTMQYWIADLRRPSASSLYGSVPVDSGGTGLDEVPVDSFLVGNGTEDMVTKTPEEVRKLINAAPSGYGLGEVVQTSSVSALSELTKSGLYTFNDDVTDNPCPGYGGNVGVDASGILTTQTVQVMAPEGNTHHGVIVRRQKSQGEASFGEWEWENPPMIDGIEYRTAERSEGLPVYAKRLVYTVATAQGSASTNTDVTIPHDISNFKSLVRCHAAKGVYALPFFSMTDNGSLSVNQVAAFGISVRAIKMAVSTGDFYFDLRYTKTS